jgi:hypothetical protein
MLRTKHLAACASVAALLGCRDFEECPTAGDLGVDRLPTMLSATGLYSDIVAGTLADGVAPYKPQFELWSDGAEKHRFILVPEGALIGTADMDSWSFPEGTKLWKEFVRDGVRVETRLFQKLGPGDEDWAAVAYAWGADQLDAAAAPSGVSDALGTEHDVPDAGQCIGCHGGRQSRILGFSAIQLSAPAEPGALDLEGLINSGRLSHPPDASFGVPGDELDRAALGYLHANCGHCHNHDRPESDGPRCFDPQKDVDFQLSVSDLAAPGDTAAYRTGEDCFDPGDSDGSDLIDRMTERGEGDEMPPLATEKVDEAAVALLRAWIDRM